MGEHLVGTTIVEDIVTPCLEALGLSLVQIKFFGQKQKTLQIMLERSDGSDVSLAECEKASRQMSSVLDKMGRFSAPYLLEVSSAGLERPLIKAKDFERFVGKDISVETYELIEKRKRFSGKLNAFVDNKVILHHLAQGKLEVCEIPLVAIFKAHVVYT